jgi:hypothetical protein
MGLGSTQSTDASQPPGWRTHVFFHAQLISCHFQSVLLNVISYSSRRATIPIYRMSHPPCDEISFRKSGNHWDLFSQTTNYHHKLCFVAFQQMFRFATLIWGHPPFLLSQRVCLFFCPALFFSFSFFFFFISYFFSSNNPRQYQNSSSNKLKMFRDLPLERVTFNKISVSDKNNSLCVDLISFDFQICSIDSLC